MNEAMADVYGKIVLNEHLKNNPLKNKNDRIALTMEFEDVCSEPNQGRRFYKDDFKKQHPDSLARMEKLTLQLPEVAKAFNCKRNQKYICYDEYLYPKKRTKSPTSDPSSKEGVQ